MNDKSLLHVYNMFVSSPPGMTSPGCGLLPAKPLGISRHRAINLAAGAAALPLEASATNGNTTLYR